MTKKILHIYYILDSAAKKLRAGIGIKSDY